MPEIVHVIQSSSTIEMIILILKDKIDIKKLRQLKKIASCSDLTYNKWDNWFTFVSSIRSNNYSSL